MPRLVALPMRCAAKGSPFHALFEWNDRRNEYVLIETVPDEAGTTKESPPMVVPGGGGLNSTQLARLGRAVGRLFKGKEPMPLPNPGPGGPSLKETPEEFNLSEFNFSGFSCPHCGLGDEVPLTEGISYVRCGKCEELVCGVRVTKVRDSLTFRCHNQCGSSGTLADSGEPLKARGVLGEMRPPAGPGAPGANVPASPAVPSPDKERPQLGSAMSLPPPKREG